MFKFVQLDFFQVAPPIETRANIVKSMLSDTENLKHKLESKDEDLKELKKQLRLKASCSAHFAPLCAQHTRALQVFTLFCYEAKFR